MTGYTGTKLKVLLISQRAPRLRRNLRSGKLDCRNLWKTKLGSLDVMKKKTPSCLKDSAVSLVVDHSGSMDGEPGRITHSLLCTLSHDMDQMRTPFEAMGFTNSGCTNQDLGSLGIRSDPVTINMMKTFSESYRLVRHRFVWPENTWGTAELPAIMFATRRLLERRETKKVLFFMSDGGTNSGNFELNEAMRLATKDYFLRMRRAGIKVVPIGIQDDDVLFYDPEAIILNDLDTFASEFYGNLTKLLL